MVNYCIFFKGTTYRIARWILQKRTRELVKAMHNFFSLAELALINNSHLTPAAISSHDTLLSA